VGLTVVLIVAILGMLMLRANPAPGRSPVARADADFQPRRRLARVALIGGPMIVVAGLLGLGVAAALEDDDPFDPRERRSEAIDDQTVTNPLDGFKAVAATDPPDVHFELTVVGGGDAAAIDRVTLAVLDEYDGRVWRTTDRFEQFDEELPGDDTLRDASVTFTLTVGGFGRGLGPYFPVVGRPVQIVDVSPVRFGERSGTMLAPESSDSTPVVEVVEVVTPVASDTLGPDPDTSYDDLRTLPAGLSTVVPDLVAELTADTADESGQLDALRGYLETSTIFDSDAPSGHAAGQIDAFLVDEAPGNEVHYATAMALMARAAGYPARVVVGWDLGEVDLAGADGVAEVSSAEYDVWAEVRLADGLGWQAVRVTPSDSGEVLADNAPGTTVPAGQLGGVQPTPFRAAPGQLLPEGEQESDSLSPWLIPLALAGFAFAWIAVFAVLILVAKRARRRRRRRAPTPSERIQGAWVDSGDRLVETGVAVEPQFTLSETVAAGQVRLGDETVEALRDLVPEVGACAYGQDPPSSEAADRAWSLADEFRRDLRGSRSIVRTAVASVDPRPLLRNNNR
ncbi:MAG: transglutaminase-like domain-containing protein, partial [Acidimicrobiia bacterium]|nr:transglutaminase-like domain-containing protein [Acidimicrobiia bacterium]